MAQVTPKLELLVDLTKPVEEIEHVISLIINAHPGKQIEILQKVDLSIGRALAEAERSSVSHEKNESEV